MIFHYITPLRWPVIAVLFVYSKAPAGGRDSIVSEQPAGVAWTELPRKALRDQGTQRAQETGWSAESRRRALSLVLESCCRWSITIFKSAVTETV